MYKNENSCSSFNAQLTRENQTILREWNCVKKLHEHVDYIQQVVAIPVKAVQKIHLRVYPGLWIKKFKNKKKLVQVINTS